MSKASPDFVLKLYVTGRSARSEQAIATLEKICAQDLEEKFELVVVDVLDNPRLAENEKIIATPTLIKELPPPVRRIIGDLSDSEKVLLGLDLTIRQ